MSEWISVKQRMPPDGQSVLVFGSKRLRIAVAYYNHHCEWLIETCSDIENIYPPTHWMPLPSPPASATHTATELIAKTVTIL